MVRKILLIIFITLSLSLQLTKEDTCRFAKYFTAEELLHNSESIDDFLRQYVRWEAKFIKQVGVDKYSGLTLDGIRVDVKSGLLLPETLHKFTASSKQCIHLAIMTKVLENSKFADQIYEPAQIFRLIQQKTQTLEKFYKQYPGFAGFLPWVMVDEGKVFPAHDFLSRVPALDNGQMFWAALSLSKVWKDKYPNILPQLRQRFDQVYWKLMIKNARTVFFNETTGKIRAVSNIQDVQLPVQANNYTNSDDYYLDDPYQGEMFTWIITLLAKDQFSPAQIDFIWQDKRKKLQSVNYLAKTIDNQSFNITVQRGFWFSSHQQWKNLFLPYFLSPTYKRLEYNSEKARTWNSAIKRLPGMYGAMAGPAEDNTEDTGYFVTGIQEIAFQKIEFDALVTPYGAFPLLLINKQYGTVWLHNTIYSPCGQTQFGALEGTGLNGSLMSPTLTWDTKITTVLAILNGTREIIQHYLEEQGLLQQFARRIQKEYSLAFPTIQGEQRPFALPTNQVKKGRADFISCK